MLCRSTARHRSPRLTCAPVPPTPPLYLLTPQPEQRQQQLVRELFATLTARSETASSFVDATAWFEGVAGARVVYRQYATLYFCAVIDGSESELGILDLVQVLVETLDRNFTNVCELDLIFNYEKVHWLVDEMIVGGLVVETNPNEILDAVEAQARFEREQSELGTAAAAAQQKIDALAGAVKSLPSMRALQSGFPR
jgi:AP-3 complex subunit sigma